MYPRKATDAAQTRPTTAFQDGTPRPLRLVRQRRLVVFLAIIFAVVALWYGASASDHMTAGDVVPASAESARADHILATRFNAPRSNMILVARAQQPVDTAGPTAAGLDLQRRLAADPAVKHIVSFWSAQTPSLRSHDGRTALLLVQLRGGEDEATQAAGRLIPHVTGQQGVLKVLANGEAVVRAEIMRQAEHDRLRGELLALPLTALLLLLVFRSAVAALLPVLVGALALAGSTAVLRALTTWTPVSVYASSISSALGFALAVDYSLFLLSRYREELAAGRHPHEALRVSLRTAGRTVAFSAATVALSLAALLVFPHTILRSIAYGGISVVVLAAAGTLLLLPAVLALLGDRVDRFDVFARWRLRRPALPGDNEGHLGTWGKTAMWVMRRPATATVAVVAGLILLASPFSHVRFTLFDDRVLPPTSDVGRAGEQLRHDFEANSTVTATAVILPAFDLRARPAALHDYARRISTLPDIVRVDTATGAYSAGAPAETQASPGPAPAGQYLSRHGVRLAVTTRGEPYTPAMRDFARSLRALPAPAPALVSGPGARLADVQDALAKRIPLAMTLVTLAMLVLVLALTRRPVLALKALLLNTLSLCATFGALVYVFQDGHFADALGGFAVIGATDALLPIMVFCIAFGLSMDYEIFLLARICEEFEACGDTRLAVAHGLDRTGRLFTWAAVTFAAVMATLGTSSLLVLKIVGVGLALAVLLDATVVRGLLVPAVMCLAGSANWWRPAHKPSKKTWPAGATFSPLSPTQIGCDADALADRPEALAGRQPPVPPPH
ncbi:MMPL family transporter [Streptomyces sp. DK15]|uniref:MMPL family transporter n=1 Tax=Streptomyces sp. DK15 TaxID=2957499 RepID=UPI0029ADECC2|nr:MMPL family transporter [Streptomyces sp. DK15]MDX2394124.1 MMPL family transporter [Streptomyces sp. DK15]